MSSLLALKINRYQLMLLRDLSYDEMYELERLDCGCEEEEQAVENNVLHLQEITDKIDKLLKDR